MELFFIGAVYVMLQFLLHYYRYVTNCYSCCKRTFLIHPDFGSFLGYLEDKAVFLPELAFMSFKKIGLFMQLQLANKEYLL